MLKDILDLLNHENEIFVEGLKNCVKAEYALDKEGFKFAIYEPNEKNKTSAASIRAAFNSKMYFRKYKTYKIYFDFSNQSPTAPTNLTRT